VLATIAWLGTNLYGEMIEQILVAEVLQLNEEIVGHCKERIEFAGWSG